MISLSWGREGCWLQNGYYTSRRGKKNKTRASVFICTSAYLRVHMYIKNRITCCPQCTASGFPWALISNPAVCPAPSWQQGMQ